MKTSEILKLTNSVQDLLNKRGKQYFMALGGFKGTLAYVENIEYNSDHCVFRMKEDSFHPDPEHGSLCIFFEHLDLNEEDWQAFLEKENKEYLEKENRKNALKEENQNNEDLELYLKLKAKFEKSEELKEKI